MRYPPYGHWQKRSWDQLKQDLTGLPCYDIAYRKLTPNQRFYVFVFEEVFRKYFGAEMVNQFRYLKNRTPYLDIDFVKALLNTRLAGVYSDFFEHKPLKRYKGQVLYAHIIKKAYPALGAIITDKGYCPDDLLTMTGHLNILWRYQKKKRQRTPSAADPYTAARSFRQNSAFYRQIPVDDELFNTGLINDEAYADPSSELYKVISLSMMKSYVEHPVEPGHKHARDEQG